MTTRGGVTRTCYTKIMNLFSSKILVQPFTGHIFFVFFFFLSIFFFFCFVIFFLLFFFFFSFFFTFLLIIFFYLCIFFPLLFLTFSYIFFSRIYFIFFLFLIYLVIFLFLYSHCHRSQVMPCWRLPTTLPQTMHRSDILNFHREYSKMYDAERISTTYIPSNRYLKRKKWTKDN